MENHTPDGTIRENLTTFDTITREINQFPEVEKNVLEHGSTYIGLKAAFCGLITVF